MMGTAPERPPDIPCRMLNLCSLFSSCISIIKELIKYRDSLNLNQPIFSQQPINDYPRCCRVIISKIFSSYSSCGSITRQGLRRNVVHGLDNVIKGCPCFFQNLLELLLNSPHLCLQITRMHSAVIFIRTH
jgi:hypothetical protein